MTNFQALMDDLTSVVGDFAEIECEIDNVQIYMDAVKARHQIAPDLSQCDWLILLNLYRSSPEKCMTVSAACLASLHTTATAAHSIIRLIKMRLIERVPAEQGADRQPLKLLPQGAGIVTRWLAIMHLNARRSVEVPTSTIISVLQAAA